jgi:hypothetical protein
MRSRSWRVHVGIPSFVAWSGQKANARIRDTRRQVGTVPRGGLEPPTRSVPSLELAMASHAHRRTMHGTPVEVLSFRGSIRDLKTAKS